MSARIIVKFNHIPELQRQTPAQVDAAIHALALDGQRDVQQVIGRGGGPSVPGDPPRRDTGGLSNSIRVRKIRRAVYRIQDGVEYGVMLEFGTRRMGARPFMRPMAERLIKRAPDFFKNFHKK